MVLTAVASRMALRRRVGISPQDRPPVPLATRSLLLRYGNAAGGEEDRRLAAKFLVKKTSVTTRHCQYLYPLH